MILTKDMKKLFISLWLLMLCVVATAQTFVVVDKYGNRKTYDVSKLDRVTFQNDPPGFTVYDNAETTNTGDDIPGQVSEPTTTVTTYTFDDVKSLAGNSDYLFVHPNKIFVNGDANNFTFQLRRNVEYEYTTDVGWLKYREDVDDSDSLRFSISRNPGFEQRIGHVYFTCADNEELSGTLEVVQTGKSNSHYIDIDWASTTLNSFDEQSGQASLTFTGNVPEMGSYDVVLLPKDGDYVIRLIDGVQQAEGSQTVTLATRQGVMGNLFKNQKFTLATESGAKSRGSVPEADDEQVYLPTKVEACIDGEYVEIFNAEKAAARSQAPVGFENEFISWEYNDDGRVLWESGVQSLSWDKLNFNIGLKGLFSFDFGDIPFEKVRMGDLQNLRIALEGGFNTELVLKYAVASEVSYEKEWTLKEHAIPNLKYTFMVGTVPVYINVGADLMANVSLGASGEASITSGVRASSTVTLGVEWDAEKGLSKIAECEKNLELVGPDVSIQAHAEARATVYPKIEIGIYKVLCPTISPQPYIKAEADGRLVDNKYVAWNAGVSTGVDLGLGLCLDLFFWKKDLGEIDPINIFDLPLVSLPDEIELLNEPEEEVLIKGKREVKYHVTNKINLTGQTYNAPGVLVHFEAEGGELEDEYGYTDKDGNVSAFFTLTDRQGGTVKAEVVLGAEGEEPEDGEGAEENEDAIKADDWKAVAIDYRLTCTTPRQTMEENAASANVGFKLDRYTSKTGEWAGFGGQTVSFEATGGSCTASAVTAPDGTVTAVFTPDEEFTEGSVTATVAIPTPDPWSASTSGKIYPFGTEDDSIEDEGLRKANELDDNTYVVDDKTFDLTGEEDYAYWDTGSTGSGYNIDFCKEHPEYATVGWGGIFNITDEMVGKEIDYLAEKANGNETLFISLGTFIDPSAGWEAPNNMIEFNADDLTEAKFLIKDNGDGTMSALAHLISNDGHEGWFKLKATKAPSGQP